MVAETLTGTRAAAAFPAFKPTGSGLLCAAYGTYEVPAAVEAGDIFELCKVPAGAVILGGHVYADDLDTGTEALDIDIGWADNGGDGTYDGVDTDGLGNVGPAVWTGDAIADVKPEVGVHFSLGGQLMNGDFPAFTRETTIQAYVNVAAGTFTAGALSVVVFYVVP